MKTLNINKNLRVYIIILSLIIFNLISIQKLYSQMIPDSLFGNNSKTSVNIQNLANTTVGAYIDGFSEYILGGNSKLHGNSQVVTIAKVDRCGIPVSSFGRNGIITYKIGFSNYISDLKLTPDGNISAAGYEASNTNGTSKSPCLYLFTPTGLPDTYLNGTGSKAIALQGAYGEFETIHPLPGNKYLATGKCYALDTSGVTGAFAIKFMPDGTGDPTFGINGITYFGTPSLVSTSSVIMPDGRIIILASGNDPFPSIIMIRSDSRGNMDHAFGSNGYIYSNQTVNTNFALIKSIIPDGESHIYTAINDPDSPVMRVKLLKINFDGVIDPTFGNNGAFYAGGSDKYTLGGISSADNYIYVFGKTERLGGSGFVIRTDSKGTFDGYFSSNGFFYPKLNHTGKHSMNAVLFHDSPDPLVIGSDQNFIISRYTKASKVPVITNQSGVLVCSGDGVYQWYHNGTLIPGATTPFYIPVARGAYTVLYTDNDGCKFSSKAYQFTGSNQAVDLMLFPNPAKESFRLIMEDNYENLRTQINVFDMSGRLLIQHTIADLANMEIDIRSLVGGSYIVESRSESRISKTILFKDN